MGWLDPSVKSRILTATATHAGERLWLFIIRLVEAPLFLINWGAALWGEWLLLTAFVQYLQLANLGFGAAGQNEATIAAGSGNTHRALAAIHTINALLFGLSLAVLIVVLLGTTLLKHLNLYTFEQIQIDTASTVIIFVSFQLILKLQISVPYAALASAKHYATASMLNIVVAVMEFMPVAIMLPLGYGPEQLAIAIALVNFVGLGVFWMVSLRYVPWLTIGFENASSAMLHALWRPSIGMLAFNFGTLLNVQGFRIVAGLTLGPATLAYLAILRTFGQTLVQVGTIFPFAVRPELSAAYGGGDMDLFQRLARRSVQLAIWVTLPGVLVGVLLGPWAISVWTAGTVEVTRAALSIVLMAAFMESVWRSAMSPSIAMNCHNRVAGAYFLTYGVVSVCLVFPLAAMLSYYGALLALLLGQLLMIIVVARLALPAAGESNFKAWFVAVTRPPYAR